MNNTTDPELINKRVWDAYGELLEENRELKKKIKELTTEIDEFRTRLINLDRKMGELDSIRHAFKDIGSNKQGSCKHYKEPYCTKWYYTNTKEQIKPTKERCALCHTFEG